MALIKNNVVFFTSLLILVTLFDVTVGGTVHKVGDTKGWTMAGVNYEDWASSKTFQVGDSLVFAYNKDFHDVTEVTHNDFELCESSKPLKRYKTGSDSITLTKPGLLHFICGVPGHCNIGQKLLIHVLPASLGPVAAPVPGPVRSQSPSPANAPQSQHQIAPSPLQSSASKSASWIGFSLLALILAF